MTKKTTPTLAEPIQQHFFSTPQLMFIGYTLAILVDLTVLNLLDEYWGYISVASFSISLLVAILLQLLLKLSIAAEHKLANYFKTKQGIGPKVARGLCTWLILVGSKIIMLEAVNIAFGDKITFTGPMGGMIAFFALIFAILIAEFIVGKVYHSLSDKPKQG